MLCENCTGHEGLNIHHIIKRSTWRETENINSLILLCHECHHNNIENGNGNLRMKLKLGLQLTYFEMGYTNEETMVLMGGWLYYEE
jgi:5-methylcytosine-specific restriction endonuclease McrA